MTDPDTRIINHALAWLDNDMERYARIAHVNIDDIREDARSALHRLFRRQCRLEQALRGCLEWFEANPVNETGQYHERQVRAALGKEKR